MYARIRYQSYLHIMCLAIIAVQGFLLFSLGARASAHVYEIRPDGETVYVGDRASNVAPRPIEAQHLASRFVELLYGWNSSTVHQDLSRAINLCDPRSLGKQLRKEVASASYIDLIRRKRVRSEIQLDEVRVVSQEDRYFKVRVVGRVHLYSLTRYNGSPVESRPIDVVLVLSVVERTPQRPTGLKIVRLERTTEEGGE